MTRLLPDPLAQAVQLVDLELGQLHMKKQTTINLSLILAIALVIASKRLQKRTGIVASDWRKELLESAIANFNSWSIEKVEKFIAEHYQ